MMNNEHGSIHRWADSHQYDAEAQPNATPDTGVMPSVHIINMPDDPLGVLAAQNGIYKGRVFRSLGEVTDDERREALDDMMKTTLQSPLEAIKIHFLFEGVDRAFTHQHVRQRTANFGQESLRFSVMGPLIEATTLPPQLHNTERAIGEPSDFQKTSFSEMVNSRQFSYASQEDRNRAVWDWVIHNIDAGYHYLAEHDMAAEEARGLLPHATATRIHYQTDMRGLMKVMGERLCTQAQFHWRMVAALVQREIRNYTPDFKWLGDDVDSEYFERVVMRWEDSNRWQFELLADSGIFRPVCYQTNECMFKASADRGCTIRERVEMNVSIGRRSEHWDTKSELGVDPIHIAAIRESEWLMNPAAARKRS